MYKDIPGYVGLYQVSDQGQVKALPRKIIRPKSSYVTHEKLMSLNDNKNGYLKVRLTAEDGSTKMFFVHRLVIETFIGPDPRQVNHKDRNRKNNALSNLEYLTGRENCIHALDKTKTASRFVGVTKHSSGKWRSRALKNKKVVYLGLYATEEQAAAAYERFLNE